MFEDDEVARKVFMFEKVELVKEVVSCLMSEEGNHFFGFANPCRVSCPKDLDRDLARFIKVVYSLSPGADFTVPRSSQKARDVACQHALSACWGGAILHHRAMEKNPIISESCT